MITYGTNPGMGMGITQFIPTTDDMNETTKASFIKSLDYMGFRPGESLLGKKIDYVFLGACTNGRIEDFRAFASLVKGRKKADHVIAWLVPGSWMVDEQIREEGLDKILEEAGFAIRQPVVRLVWQDDDKIPAGKYSVSTKHRNFEGRQGPGGAYIAGKSACCCCGSGDRGDYRSERNDEIGFSIGRFTVYGRSKFVNRDRLCKSKVISIVNSKS